MKLLWSSTVGSKERGERRKSKRSKKINTMMEGDTVSVGGLSRSRWLMLGEEVGRVMPVRIVYTTTAERPACSEKTVCLTICLESPRQMLQ